MKPSLVLPALVVVSALAAAACTVTVEGARYSTREEKHWSVTGTPDLTLVTFDGSVEVRSWDKPEVRVEIEKQAADKAHADEIEVAAEQSGGTIRVEAKKPRGVEGMFGLRVSPSARLVALVPRSCNLVVRTGDGSITVERIDGRVELNTGDGSLTGTELSGTLRAHTGDGGITFEAIDGRVDIDTGDGGGRLTGKLAAVRLRTGDGSLAVRAEDGSSMTDDWEIRTGDGGVRLELPEAFAASLDASTGDGSVHVDGFGEPTGGKARDDDSHGSLRRELGPGGKLLRVRSGSGEIRVRKL